jgi:hypothetical protein
MSKLIKGILIGFGLALSIVAFAAWTLLLMFVESGYLIVGEAKVMEGAQTATVAGVVLGVLLVVAGVGLRQCGKATNRS